MAYEKNRISYVHCISVAFVDTSTGLHQRFSDAGNKYLFNHTVYMGVQRISEIHEIKPGSVRKETIQNAFFWNQITSHCPDLALYNISLLWYFMDHNVLRFGSLFSKRGCSTGNISWPCYRISSSRISLHRCRNSISYPWISRYLYDVEAKKGWPLPLRFGESNKLFYTCCIYWQ